MFPASMFAFQLVDSSVAWWGSEMVTKTMLDAVFTACTFCASASTPFFT